MADLSIRVGWGSRSTIGVPSLPPGVTLQEPDGGLDYYSSWSNAAPLHDPNFLPIGIFNSYDLNATQPNGMTRINGHIDAGINIYVHLANGSEGVTSGGTDIQAIAAKSGIYLLADPTQAHVTDGTYLSTYGSKVIGWAYQDETEGSGCGVGGTNDWFTEYAWLISGAGTSCTIGTNSKKNPQFLLDTANYLRTQDSTRLVYQGYTNGFAFDWFLGGPVIKFAQSGDIVGYDVYAITDHRSTFGGQTPGTGNAWAAYESVTAARANANYTVPILPDVEMNATDCTSGMNDDCRIPTDAQIAAIVVHYIIGGARGYTWFPHCFCSPTQADTNDAVNDTTNYPTIHGVVKAIDEKMQSLASVINSYFALGYITASSTVNIMAKWMPSENAFYVFAAINQTSGATVNFTITGSPTRTVEVLFESRTINMSNGAFSDSFTGIHGWHIYKIPN